MPHLPLSPLAAFSLALIFTVAFRFAVYAQFSVILGIMSQKAPLSALRLGKFGETCAVICFLSLGMGLAGIENQAAGLVFLASGLIYAFVVIGSVMTSATDRIKPDN